MSPLQEGLLFRQMWNPQGGEYIEQVSIALSGITGRRLVAASWQRLVDAHAILRTSFVIGDGAVPTQVVLVGES